MSNYDGMSMDSTTLGPFGRREAAKQRQVVRMSQAGGFRNRDVLTCRQFR